MRMAPSRRMTSPLSIRFSTMWRTRAAYSSGWPRRGGKGTWAPRESRTWAGRAARMGVWKGAGGEGEGLPGAPRVGGGVGGLADLAVERGHRGGVDDHAPLAVVERLVGRPGLGGPAGGGEGGAPGGPGPRRGGG